MKILLDTNAFLWAHIDPERLGPHLPVVQRASTVRMVSAVVGWEIAIKHGLGRLELPEPPSSWVPSRVRRGAMTTVSIELAHVLAVGELEDHHRDPFDRLLISQANALGVPILTADRIFERYDVETLMI